MNRRPPKSPLFPSPTLFRSGHASSTRSVTVAAGQTATADFALGTQALMLDSLVAVGYTTQRRTTVSDAVAEVSAEDIQDRKSTRLNSSHANISYAVFCLKKK